MISEFSAFHFSCTKDMKEEELPLHLFAKCDLVKKTTLLDFFNDVDCMGFRITTSTSVKLFSLLKCSI